MKIANFIVGQILNLCGLHKVSLRVSNSPTRISSILKISVSSKLFQLTDLNFKNLFNGGLGLLVVLIFSSCQQKPTRIIEETVNPYQDRTLYVDVRSDLKAQTSPIEGAARVRSEEFLILQNTNPKKKSYRLDPDYLQIVERLAKRGIGPLKKIYLVYDKESETESFKIRWLLRQLQVDIYQRITETEARKRIGARRSPNPDPQNVWELAASPEVMEEFLYRRSKDCFINWTKSKCE